jgi:hypothetical protein
LPRPYLRPALEAARQIYGSFFEPVINANTAAYKGGSGGINMALFIDALTIAGIIYAAGKQGEESVGDE